jgi:hypothetical protein
MSKQRQRFTIVKVCFFIAVIIFVTAVCSDFSVRMFYSSTDPTIQVVAGLIAIGFIALVLLLFLLAVPELKRALLRMFGMD